MLTVQAFNALLKTLEEPPQHVKFILATTDVHKIPQTIISRCQRFDFLPLNNETISDRLKFIAESESQSIDDKSLSLIASKSEGSMRDALSYLDQILVLGEDITYKLVQDLLGIVPSEILFSISDALHDSDGDKLISELELIRNKGYIVEDLLKDLILHFRNLSVKNFKNGLKLSGVDSELAKKYNIDNNFIAEGPSCSPIYQFKDNDGKISLPLRTLFSQEMIKNKILMPWITLSYRHGEKEFKLTEKALNKVFPIIKLALDNGVDGYLKGEVIKPVFRTHN